MNHEMVEQDPHDPYYGYLNDFGIRVCKWCKRSEEDLWLVDEPECLYFGRTEAQKRAAR